MGTRSRRIVLNALWLFLHQVVANVAALFVVGFVADRLGKDRYGLLEWSIAYVTLFTPIVFAGIQLILVREIVADPTTGPRAAGDALIVRLLVTPLFVGLVLAIAPFAASDIPPTLLWLSIANGFLVMYVSSPQVAFEASERMRIIAVSGFVNTVVGMALSVVAVLIDSGAEGVMAARLAGNVAQFLVCIVWLPLKLYRPVFDPSLRRYGRILRQGIPLAIQFQLSLVLLEVDKTMLGKMLGEAAVGLYSSATVLAYKFDMVALAVGTAILPPLVAAWNEGPPRYEALLGKALRTMLILGLPVAVGTWFVSEELMGFIFGDQYLPASRVLAILTCFVPLLFMSRVLSLSLGARRLERYVPIGIGVALGTNVLLNWLLIPRMGYEGAGIATVGSEALLVAIYLFVQRDHLLEALRHMKLLRLCAASLAMAGVCYLVRNQNVLVIIAAAAVTYGVAVVALRCVSRDELRQVLGRDAGRPTIAP